MKRLFIVTIALFIALSSVAQQGRINIKVTPDHADWVYNLGQSARFKVAITQDGKPMKDVAINYIIGYEKMQPYIKVDTLLPQGTMEVEAQGMVTPGMLMCRVFTKDKQGKTIFSMAQVAYEPEKIRPTTPMPDDFKEFWEGAKADNAKIPLESVMTLAPEFCTDKIDVYHIRVNNFRPNCYVYGYLCLPKGVGESAAILYLPGAGVSKIQPAMQMAEKGVITLAIGIHGIPLTMEKQVYADLYSGPMNSYKYHDLDDRDNYYYKRVLMGCVRAVDFIYTLPSFDKQRMMVWGGSQGGGLTIATAGLDERVKYFVSFYPVFCDHYGYLNGRAGGWPHFFSRENMWNINDRRIATAPYYDAVNFVQLTSAQGFFSWGYNDLSCPVTGLYAMYNIVKSPKTLFVDPKMAHARSKEQDKAAMDWAMSRLFGGQ